MINEFENNIEAFGQTDVGMMRTINQDSTHHTDVCLPKGFDIVLNLLHFLTPCFLIVRRHR